MDFVHVLVRLMVGYFIILSRENFKCGIMPAGLTGLHMLKAKMGLIGNAEQR